MPSLKPQIEFEDSMWEWGQWPLLPSVLCAGHRGKGAVKPLGQPGHRRKREICPRWGCLKGIPLRKSLKMNEEPLGDVTGLLLRNIGFGTEEPVPDSYWGALPGGQAMKPRQDLDQPEKKDQDPGRVSLVGAEAGSSQDSHGKNETQMPDGCSAQAGWIHERSVFLETACFYSGSPSPVT